MDAASLACIARGLADEGELTGAIVVAWMVERGWASSVCEAVIIGARMVQRGLLEAQSTSKCAGFHNESIRYRLVGHASSDVAEQQREAGNRGVAEILELPLGQIAAEIDALASRARAELRGEPSTQNELGCRVQGTELIAWFQRVGVAQSVSQAGMVCSLLCDRGWLTRDDETARHDDSGEGDPADRSVEADHGPRGSSGPWPEAEGRVRFDSLAAHFLLLDTRALSAGEPVSNETARAREVVAAQVSRRGERRAEERVREEALRADALRAQTSQLEELAALEQAELAREEAALAEEARQLGELMECCSSTGSQANERQAIAEQERAELWQTRLLLEARQVKLIGELHAIYPIHETEAREFAIRGLELPVDLSSKDDEHVSSALGFVCHVMVMLSKYLEVPLRYQLIFSASRSLVRDRVFSSGASGGTYPLFRKGVDRERFERAVRLLEADVEQLLVARDAEFDPRAPVLANLRSLFTHELRRGT